MKRPVPDGHITSPPQSVSIPRTASATKRPTLSMSRLLFLQRTKPNVQAQTDEKQRRNCLRNRLVRIKRCGDKAFAILGEQPQRGAKNTAQRTARHQSGSDNHASLANSPARLAFRLGRPLIQKVRDEPANQRRRVEF